MNRLKDVKKIGKKMNKKKLTKWVKKYQKKNPDKTHGWLYGCDVLCKILEDDKCDGIWFFKAINDEGEERLVLYPADHNGNILETNLKSLGAKSGGGDDDAFDDGDSCPENCPSGLGD